MHRSYYVPVQIDPRDDTHCGACAGWGAVGAEDLCMVFKRRLAFNAKDPECLTKGYRRCTACKTWEKQHRDKDLEVCAHCGGTGDEPATMPEKTCTSCKGCGERGSGK